MAQQHAAQHPQMQATTRRWMNIVIRSGTMDDPPSESYSESSPSSP
jgi:hypothetical protein